MPETIAMVGGTPVGRECSQGSRLVSLHEAAVADHVGGQERGELAFHERTSRKPRLLTLGHRIYAADPDREFPRLASERSSAMRSVQSAVDQ